MFESALVDSSAQRKQQEYATLVSFAAQIAIGVALILLPFLYTQNLPALKLISVLKAPASSLPQAEVHTTSQRVPNQTVTEVFNGHLQTPRAIPRSIQLVTTQEFPVAPASVPGVPGAVPGDAADRILRSLLDSVPTQPTAPKPAAPRTVPVSQGVAAGLLAEEVKPAYPRIAQQAGIQGAVVLKALISKEGRIENLRVISGHPMLIHAAMEAVRQWRYKPYLLNGEPVEVETQITVNFVLSGR